MSYSSEIKSALSLLEEPDCCARNFSAAAAYKKTRGGFEQACEAFVCGNCKGAYLRGIFVSFGSIVPPEKKYHLELSLSDKTLADHIHSLLDEAELSPNLFEKPGIYRLYYKESEKIEDFLYLIGAHNASYDFMNAKIIKDVRNNVNRTLNFENANMKKITEASARHISAIRILTENGMFEKLDSALRECALHRLENIEYSLAEIGRLCSPPVSKAGVKRRLDKIAKMAENTRGISN